MATATGDTLIDMCTEVAAGAPSDGLKTVLDEALEALTATLTEFSGTIAALEPQVHQACSEAIDVCISAVQAQINGLRELHDALDEERTEDLPELARQAAEQRLAASDAFFMFRSQALVAMGPTRVPGINMLLMTKARLEAGEDVQALLQEQVTRERAGTSHLLTTLESEGASPTVREPLQEYLTALDQLSDTPTDALIELAERLDTALTAHSSERMYGTPTSMPPLNRLLHLSAEAMDDVSLVGLLQEAAAQFVEELERIRRRAGALNVAEEALPLLESLDASVHQLVAAVANGIEESWQRSMDEIQATAAELQSIFDSVAQAAEREGKVPCIRCSHYNRPDRKVCEQCGAVLPRSMQGVEQSGDVASENGAHSGSPQMTEHVQRLLEAARDAGEGALSDAEFAAVLQDMEVRLAQAQAVTTEGEDTPDVRTLRSMYQEGLDGCASGLGFMRDFLKSHDAAHIQIGTQQFLKGVARLQEVQRLTEGAAE